MMNEIHKKTTKWKKKKKKKKKTKKRRRKRKKKTDEETNKYLLLSLSLSLLRYSSPGERHSLTLNLPAFPPGTSALVYIFSGLQGGSEGTVSP